MELNQAYALCLRPGDTAFDVGANVGMTAAVMSPLVGPKGRCVSFECHPVHFARLSFLASREGFENVLPYCRALSGAPGHISMFSGSDPAAAQASTIVTDLANSNRLGQAILRLKVETDTIDRICESLGYVPQLLKIDVEGAEAQVISGARATIRKYLPHLVFEFGYGFDDGKIPEHFQFLREAGYDLFVTDLTNFSGRPVSFCPSAILFSVRAEDLGRTRAHGNIFAVHSSKRDALLRGTPVQPFSDVEKTLAKI